MTVFWNRIFRPPAFSPQHSRSQDRRKPTLELQVAALEGFARQRGMILVFLSQVDRSFELSARRIPGLGDIRLPNPVRLDRFARTCFLNDGEVCFS